MLNLKVMCASGLSYMYFTLGENTISTTSVMELAACKGTVTTIIVVDISLTLPTIRWSVCMWDSLGLWLFVFRLR